MQEIVSNLLTICILEIAQVNVNGCLKNLENQSAQVIQECTLTKIPLSDLTISKPKKYFSLPDL